MTTTTSMRLPNAIALVTMLSLLYWSMGFPFWVGRVQAENVENFRDLISESAPGIDSNHYLSWTTENGIELGETIEITFPAGFNLGSVVEDDVDILRNGTQLTTAVDCAAADNVGIGVAGQTITLTVCPGDGGNYASSSVVEIHIGTMASSSGAGVNQINNHATPASYLIQAGGTMSDTGDTRIVMVDYVTATAVVETIFTFTISGVATSTFVNNDASTSTMSSTTATELNFGILEPGIAHLLAQRLNVWTNARSGFSVTIRSDGPLTSATGADIDDFANGGASSTPAAWASPVGYLGEENTYGHLGITSSDMSLATTASGGDPFGAGLYSGDYTQRDVEVMYHASSSDGITDHIGSTTVGFKAEIMSLQEAGNDYTAIFTYIATPTF